MIDMQVGNYHITSDTYNVIVARMARGKDHKLTGSEKTLGYYNTLVQALAGVKDRWLRDDDDEIVVKTIDDYVQTLQQAERAFGNAIKQQATSVSND